MQPTDEEIVAGLCEQWFSNLISVIVASKDISRIPGNLSRTVNEVSRLKTKIESAPVRDMLAEISARLIQLVAVIHEGLLAHHRDVLRQLVVQLNELQQSADAKSLYALSGEFTKIITAVTATIAKL